MVSYRSTEWEGKGLLYYLKHRMRHTPEMLLMLPFYGLVVPALIGIIYYNRNQNAEFFKFREQYLVIRSDDPRVEEVNKVVALPLTSSGTSEPVVASAIHSGPSPSPGSSSSCEENCKPPPRNCYRLVVLGSSRVGKTCIVARFLNNKFEESYTPTIEDFHRKLYRIRGEVHQLDILDTSGNHPFPAMRRLSFLTGDLFLLVFSMDSRESFEEVIRLREQILETKLSASSNNTGGRKRLPNLRIPMVIVGNKCDKDMRTVSLDEAKTFAALQDENCSFIETSAKRNIRIDDLFYELFLVSGLPLEMAPNHHKRINPQFGSPCTLPPSVPSPKSKKCTISIKRRLSDACGVVAPNVRRPSIRTDLMIMRTKTAHCLGGGSGTSKTSRESIHNNQTRCVLQ